MLLLLPPGRRPSPRTPLRLAALGVLAVLVPTLVAGNCGSESRIHVTLNAVPPPLNEVLVVPPSGFTVDVTFPDPQAVDSQTLALEVFSFDGSSREVTGDLVVQEPDRAVAVVSTPLAAGSHWIEARVRTSEGTAVAAAAMTFAVRPHPSGGPPLDELQWVQLDFAADPDGDGQPDLPGDLAAVGLRPDDPGLQGAVTAWVVDEILARAQAFYDTADPSGLPGGDPADLVFAPDAPPSGPFTRICVGGADPSGSGVIGNVLFDPGNANPDQVACDTFSPAGVFPREMTAFSGSAAFQDAFGPVLAVPVGTHPLDAVVLGPGFDPSDPGQLARYQEIEAAVHAFSQAVATVAAHETGHAVGLVPRGAPGGGLFGGSSGPLDTHNVTPEGGSPSESWLMNAGGTFSFAELTGHGGTPLPRLRALNFAYLRGRLVLDARVTAIHPPPVLDYATPSTIALSGPSVLTYTCTGRWFLPTPAIRLVGPLTLGLLSETLVSEEEVTATIPVLQLAPGTYDLEFTNGDGQVVVLPDAVEVVP